MTHSVLAVDQRGAVRWLCLNRPAQRNALNGDLTNALAAQVASISADDDTAVVVLAGNGPSFSAGGDFRHFLAMDEGDGVVEFLAQLSDVVSLIEKSPKPWIAALHGHAIAGGLELALACDVVIASEGTAIADGHLNNKLLPGAGSSVRLERAVGKSTARWLHLSGQSLTAEQLLPTGWIHDVVPGMELRRRAQEIAMQLASRDSRAQQSMKGLLGSIYDVEDSVALRAELESFAENWRQNNVADALRAFLADRTSSRPSVGARDMQVR